MYKFLFSRRWVGFLVMALIFAVACVFLGRWQMDRRAETLAQIQRVLDNYNSTPVPFAQAEGLFRQMDINKEWKQVRLDGEYIPADERVVRNRPANGQPGYEVVVPFRTDAGQTVIVDRGWLPIGNDEGGKPDAVPAPPAGKVSVVVRMRPAEPALNRGAPEGQLASIDLQTYASQLSYPILEGAYGRMATETPAPATAPLPLPMPDTSEGTHLSYSLQWFAFGVLMLIGFGYAARQQVRNDRLDAEDAALQSELAHDGDAPGCAEPAPSHTAAKYWRESRKKADRKAALRRVSGKRTAEDEEDEILDSQGYR